MSKPLNSHIRNSNGNLNKKRYGKQNVFNFNNEISVQKYTLKWINDVAPLWFDYSPKPSE